MNDTEDFLTFRKMVTPVIIQALFWIGAGIFVLAGLMSIGTGMRSNYGGGGTVLFGLMMLVLGPVAVRIYCELLIVIFRINETLTDIRNSVKPADRSMSPGA